MAKAKKMAKAKMFCLNCLEWTEEYEFIMGHALCGTCGERLMNSTKYDCLKKHFEDVKA